VSAGYEHACGLTNAGDFDCWGADGYGESSDIPSGFTGEPRLLRCNIDTPADDADGDDISYTFEWDVDGDAYTDTDTTTHTGDSVSWDALGYDEIWTCQVTPDDGEEDGSLGRVEYETACVPSACDGWTNVYKAASTDLNSTSLGYDVSPGGWSSATQVMIGFENPETRELSNTAIFDIPSQWRSQSPMKYRDRTQPIDVSINDGEIISATLVYGFSNWGPSCSSFSGGSGNYGKVAVCSTGGPYWSRFAKSGGDRCAIAPSPASSPLCSDTRVFNIWVR
jgi:hypothetical protein